MLTATCEDNIAMMRRYPDKYFDLAIVDPPYEIKQDGHRENSRTKLAKSKDYHKALWDQKAPPPEYFDELFRVSKNQVIFGANHFIDKIPYPSPCWLVWDKMNPGNFADCELAWTSFKTAVRIFRFKWAGMLQGDMKNKEVRIHPTQKPVKLYEWILSKYAKPGFKILDTHRGSGSLDIACYRHGFDLVTCDIDPVYFADASERYLLHTSQEHKVQHVLQTKKQTDLFSC